MISVPFGQTVTLMVSSTGSADALGNDTRSYAPSDIDGCVVYPQMFSKTGKGTAAENAQGGDQVETSMFVLFPEFVAVKATDRVVIGGLLFEVEGEAHPYTSPLTGLTPGLQVGLRRVTG